jgi:hypothetical protein
LGTFARTSGKSSPPSDAPFLARSYQPEAGRCDACSAKELAGIILALAGAAGYTLGNSAAAEPATLRLASPNVVDKNPRQLENRR